MKRHKRIYMEFFNLSTEERVPCERCWKAVAVDVHHCERRGMGGDQTGEKDVIENLGGVCRGCHEILDAIPDENEKFKSWCANLDGRKQKMRRVMYGG
jgi:hypothetical protein